MKRFAGLFLLAAIIAGLCASGVHASPSRGADCLQCHSFPNQPPVANAGADQTGNAGASVTLNGGSSRDSDDGIASYAWTQTGGTAVTLSNAGTSRATFTAPNVTTQTVLTFRLTVTDRLPQSATDTCTVTVRPVGSSNQPPVANAGADLTVTAGSQVSLSGSASTDPDDGIASYAWTQTGTPAVTLTNANGANASFSAPQVSSATVLTFQLRVTDRSGASTTDTCTVRVNFLTTPPAGGAPVANAGTDLVVLPGTIINLDGFYSTDPDGDIVSYAWTQTGGTSVTLSDATAMSPLFQAPNSPSTLAFRLVVTDGSGRQSSDTCTVTVTSAESAPPSTPTNQLPVANAGADQSVRPGTTVRLSGTGSRDADDGIASYRWQQTSGPTVRLYGTTAANARFVAPRVSTRTTIVMRLTVKDRAGQSATDSVTITVSTSGGDDDEEDD